MNIVPSGGELFLSTPSTATSTVSQTPHMIVVRPTSPEDARHVHKALTAGPQSLPAWTNRHFHHIGDPLLLVVALLAILAAYTHHVRRTQVTAFTFYRELL